MFGEPGVGKSLLALDIVARLSSGRPMAQSSEARPPCNVLLLCAEDGAADTIKPRLEAAGADCSRVHVFQDGGHSAFPDSLHQYIVDCAPALVVVDPLTAYLNRLDLHSDKHMRRLFTILSAIAGVNGVSFLLIHHQNKRSTGSALLRCAGSTAIVAAARSVMAVARDPNDSGSRILVHVKGNLSARPASLRFHVDESGPKTKIAWDGVAEGVVADRLLAARQEPDSALMAALNFLKETLAPGPLPSRELEDLAMAQGITKATYDRARVQVTSASRVGGVGAEGAWVTSLRPSANRQSAPPA
jgi:hypothetical protein